MELFDERSFRYDEFDTAFLAYVSLLMIIGIVGNICVFVVFLLKFNKSNYKTFVVCLSLIDFLVCCFGMPKTFMLIRCNYVFENIATCKTMTFVVKYLAGNSITILFIIAIDRYWKVCQPMKSRVYHFHGQIAVGVSSAVTFLLVSPAIVLYGETKSINGTEIGACTVRDEYSSYNKAFEGTMFVILVAMFLTLVVSYALIGRAIYKSRKTFKTKQKNVSTFFVPLYPTEDTDDTSCSRNNVTEELEPKPRISKSTNKRTNILFIITAVAVCSWIPHFTLESMHASYQHMYDTASPGMVFLYRILFFSYYWNTILNPFLYGMCDLRFRSAVKTWLYNVLYICGLRAPRSTTFRAYPE